ncbi:MAG: response regulator [Acidiferrobacterales bacterium]|nr:response regulator [Acidiferrobacterales bacterium]
MSAEELNTTTQILVVDDDSDQRWMVENYLGKHGFKVHTADGGEAMRTHMENHEIDIVLLDVTMPGEDGFTLAKYLREHENVGIIMLTASTELVDRVLGLELGADDYMTKPFEPRELMARIKSLIRRLQSETPSESADITQAKTQFGSHTLDLDAQMLLDESGVQVSITSMEFDLLKAFAENPGRVLNRDTLLTLAHKKDWDPFDRSIDIRIARLRRKIEPNPSKPSIIKTVRGAGYIFVVSE